MRKTEDVRVPESFETPGGGPSRDAGKVYRITEWSAADAEDWAFRFLLACGRGGTNVDFERALGAGWEFIFWSGINTLLAGAFAADEVIPILNRLLTCVTIVRDPSRADVATGQAVAHPITTPDDIAEVQTRLWLRAEVIRVHAGFSPADAASALLQAASTRSEQRPTPPPSPEPQTSPP